MSRLSLNWKIKEFQLVALTKRSGKIGCCVNENDSNDVFYDNYDKDDDKLVLIFLIMFNCSFYIAISSCLSVLIIAEILIKFYFAFQFKTFRHCNYFSSFCTFLKIFLGNLNKQNMLRKHCIWNIYIKKLTICLKVTISWTLYMTWNISIYIHIHGYLRYRCV